MSELNVGDTIHFMDAESMAYACERLGNEDVQTDFIFEKDGKKGYWLVVTGLEHIPMFDEVKQTMCDCYCKYPCFISDQDELDKICAECPLDKYEV